MMPEQKHDDPRGAGQSAAVPGMGACSCTGPLGNDQHCPCEMRRRGLQPTDIWTQANRDKLTAALACMLGWPGAQATENGSTDSHPTDSASGAGSRPAL
jgi:hypothetical protein